jgi:hypothetical protein
VEDPLGPLTARPAQGATPDFATYLVWPEDAMYLDIWWRGPAEPRWVSDDFCPAGPSYQAGG